MLTTSVLRFIARLGGSTSCSIACNAVPICYSSAPFATAGTASALHGVPLPSCPLPHAGSRGFALESHSNQQDHPSSSASKQALSTAEPSGPLASQRSSESKRRDEILRVREAIFGVPTTEDQKDGRAILARKLQGREVASWYFLPSTETPGIHNEETEYVMQRNTNRRKKPEPGVEVVASTKKKKK